jgi:hypothetical protein
MDIFAQTLHQTLSLIDNLASAVFPQAAMGMYQQAICIGPLIGESLKVRNCTGFKYAFICRIEISIPQKVKSVVELIPVRYQNIALTGENHQQRFILNANSPYISLLECSPQVVTPSQTALCTVKNLASDCEEAIRYNDVFKSFSSCNFSRNTNYPPAILLPNGAILVHGQGATIDLGSNADTVATSLPVIISTSREVVVRSKGENYVFSPSSTSMTESTTVSALSQASIDYLETLMTWKEFWEQFQVMDYVNLALLGVQTLLLPVAFLPVAWLKRQLVSKRNKRTPISHNAQALRLMGRRRRK